MRIIIFAALIFVFACENAEKSPHSFDEMGLDTVALDTFIINNYKEDAKQLYLNELSNNISHKNYNIAILDTSQINIILAIIQHVFDSDYPERDTIFNIYKIHGYYCYSFSSVYLKVKTELSAIKNLIKGKIPTGDLKLDQLLITYHFDSVRTFYGYPDFPWLTIYTKKEYNMIPIVRAFEGSPSVIMADFNRGCIGDGNNIQLIRNEDSATIIFSIGDGDCPSQCIYHKYWEFHVENGLAEFVKSYED